MIVRLTLPLLIISTCFLCVVDICAQITTVSNVSELESQIAEAQPGFTILLADGDYNNIQLIVTASGTEDKPILIKAKNPGRVIFSGDVKVELHGEYITLDGIYFKDGNRKINEWKSHGPGLVAIYGSYNRITQCAFHCFDQANSAYITTSVTKSGKVPQYCRIDHCSFTEKITFDQVINLNNTPRADKTPGAAAAVPMYHRIDHCFFANPKKPGNAGGGIRVGYWRKDEGRCLVDSNLFMRQDSEPEIITSKSRENVYYANTFLNCRGTLNFRHGDKQVAIGNHFIGTDTNFEYGGMFVWGSQHLIAGNYFDLPTTIKSRGNAALYLNPGARAAEHALAFDISICNNVFNNINGHTIHFQPLAERRIEYCQQKNLTFEYPTGIRLNHNIFANSSPNYALFNMDDLGIDAVGWQQNTCSTYNMGIKIKNGMQVKDTIGDTDNYVPYVIYQIGSEYSIEGIGEDILMKANMYNQSEALTFDEVGPDWLIEVPGTYALNGKLAKSVQLKLKEVINKRK